MKRALNTIFIVCLCIFGFTNNGKAEDVCPGKSESECTTFQYCVYSAGTCKSCGSKEYRDTTKTPYECASCTNGPTDKEGKACGTEGAACQYPGDNGDNPNCKWTMTCPIKTGEEFPHGQWAPDESSITYNGTGEPPSCTYTNTHNITCDVVEGNPCESYRLAQGGTECVPVALQCFNGTTWGMQFYPNYEVCYLRADQCKSDEELRTIVSCGDTHYGVCIKSQIPCTQSDKAATLTSVCQEQGATLSDNATLISGTLSYDYSGCKCTKTITPEHAPSGSGTYSCNFLSDGSKIDGSTCTTTVSQCNAGFCIVDNSTQTPSCVEVPSGYYKTDSLNTGCVKCPTGASSNAGNTMTTMKDACYYTSATQFRDSSGSFSIPASNIKIKWN